MRGRRLVESRAIPKVTSNAFERAAAIRRGNNPCTDTPGAGMGYVRLLGFSTLACGCLVGRYREIGADRVVTYVEQKGATCADHRHRRNHTIRQATLRPDLPPRDQPRAL
jgi:hypothetical protein